MFKIEKFEDLVVWQEAHKLTLLIYKITSQFPQSEKFNLTSQMRRAAVSVESCIAEGYGRFHYKDRINFYYDARGSLNEVLTQLLVAKDLSYMNQENFQSASDQIKKTELILGGLIRSTKARVDD